MTLLIASPHLRGLFPVTSKQVISRRLNCAECTIIAHPGPPSLGFALLRLLLELADARLKLQVLLTQYLKIRRQLIN